MKRQLDASSRVAVMINEIFRHFILEELPENTIHIEAGFFFLRWALIN